MRFWLRRRTALLANTFEGGTCGTGFYVGSVTGRMRPASWPPRSACWHRGHICEARLPAAGVDGWYQFYCVACDISWWAQPRPEDSVTVQSTCSPARPARPVRVIHEIRLV